MEKIKIPLENKEKSPLEYYELARDEAVPLENLLEFMMSLVLDEGVEFIYYPEPEKTKKTLGRRKNREKWMATEPGYDPTRFKAGERIIDIVSLYDVGDIKMDLRHANQDEAQWLQVIQEEAESMSKDLAKKPYLAGLVSRLITRIQDDKGEVHIVVKHIPMIDFECPINKENKVKILNLISELGQKDGFLLESGQSYHFYGAKLLEEMEWKKFNEKLAKNELIGQTWPKLQVEDGFSVLRITTSPLKPTMPKVIALIGEVAQKKDDFLKKLDDTPRIKK